MAVDKSMHMVACYLFGDTRAKVLQTLFADPIPKTIRLLSDQSGISHSAVYEELRKLIALNLVVRHQGQPHAYIPNPDHPNYSALSSLLR